jgi:siroheme synthase
MDVALAQEEKVQKCNEFGTVVVQITVNRNGNVIAAKYTKGTTNTNPCLVEQHWQHSQKVQMATDADAKRKLALLPLISN